MDKGLLRVREFFWSQYGNKIKIHHAAGGAAPPCTASPQVAQHRPPPTERRPQNGLHGRGLQLAAGPGTCRFPSPLPLRGGRGAGAGPGARAGSALWGPARATLIVDDNLIMYLLRFVL